MTLLHQQELWSCNCIGGTVLPSGKLANGSSLMMGPRRCLPAFALLLLCVLPLPAPIQPAPTNPWQQGAALSTARTGATATLMADGRILIVGGKDGNGNALETAEVLNTDGTIAPV